jgi:hypothetical protein
MYKFSVWISNNMQFPSIRKKRRGNLCREIIDLNLIHTFVNGSEFRVTWYCVLQCVRLQMVIFKNRI